MVYVNDLEKFSSEEEPRRLNEKSTLLKKYNIPLNYLDYDYVEKCTNPRDIEKILHILRSGEEGYYPDLVKKTEEKLRKLKPNSKFLREMVPVIKKNSLNRNELQVLTDDMNNFLVEIEKNSEELNDLKCNNLNLIDVPVRKSKTTQEKSEVKNNQKRISSTDYASWDKYDVDTEILKMEIDEERTRKEATQKINKEKSKKPEAKSVKFNKFLTKTEAVYESNREREKGNEFYKVGDYEDALSHYTNSIMCQRNVHAYNNRALVYIKLKKYKSAIDDCNSALELEPNNVKALLRKAQSHDNLNEYKEALDCVEIAVELSPNNTTAQELAEKLRCTLGIKEFGCKRLTIDEVGGSSSDNKEKASKEKRVDVKPILKTKMELIPISGSSNMKPPYYKYVNTKDPSDIERFYREMLSRPRVYCLTPIDNDADDCVEIHIKPSSSLSDGDKKRCEDIKNNNTLKNNDVKDETIQMTRNVNKNDDKVQNHKSYSRKMTNYDKRNLVTNQIKMNDKGGGGEPLTNENETDLIIANNELHSPYTFLKTWNAISKDDDYSKHAEVLRRLNMERITEVVGCKMDNRMFSVIINCLYRHFCVVGQIDKVYVALMNLATIQRFNIISMLMSDADKVCLKNLIKFLRQHGKDLPEHIRKKYFQ